MAIDFKNPATQLVSVGIGLGLLYAGWRRGQSINCKDSESGIVLPTVGWSLLGPVGPGYLIGRLVGGPCRNLDGLASDATSSSAPARGAGHNYTQADFLLDIRRYSKRGAILRLQGKIGAAMKDEAWVDSSVAQAEQQGFGPAAFRAMQAGISEGTRRGARVPEGLQGVSDEISGLSGTLRAKPARGKSAYARKNAGRKKTGWSSLAKQGNGIGSSPESLRRSYSHKELRNLAFRWRERESELLEESKNDRLPRSRRVALEEEARYFGRDAENYEEAMRTKGGPLGSCGCSLSDPPGRESRFTRSLVARSKRSGSGRLSRQAAAAARSDNHIKAAFLMMAAEAERQARRVRK